MPQAAYPTTADVQTFIEAMGLTAPSNLDTIVDGVVSEFERKTGYQPFLADAAATTWTFDPPYQMRGFRLNLEGAFFTVTAVEVNDTALTITDDYTLLPLNAARFVPVRGWDELMFKSHPGTLAGSIEVTGRRGLYAALPDDVYQAIFNKAARLGISAGSASGLDVKRVKQGTREVEYATGKDGEVLKLTAWDDEFAATITRYVRMP